jgi:type II secretory pathway component GspD/PulD (secretin)
VLQLSVLDATSVSDLLTAVYSSGQTDFRGRSVARPGQPRIQPDEAHSRIVIRGSKKQIDDIKLMLAKLGETSLSSGGGSDRMFLIPNGQNQRTTLEQIKQVWDTAHPNNAVRIIDLGRRTGQPGRGDATDGTEPSSGPPRDPEAIKDRSNSPAEDESPAKPRGARPMSGSGRPDHTSRDSRSDVKFASLTDQDPPQPPSDVDSTARQQPGKEGSPIVIAPGPDVTVITCEDPEALQRFMTLFNTLMRGSGGGGQDYNVFYLKAADATQVSTQLLDLLAPSSTSTSGGGFPFFGGGTPARTSTLKIVPDTRTNSLIVSGTTNDVLRVGQLLEVLDRADAPSSGALSAPRIIPVKYSSAATVYQVIRDVYSTQLVAGSRGPSGFPGFTVGGFGGFGGGQSPGGSGGTSGRGARGAGTLSIGVDDRSNSLVVSCSEATYKEINQLVELLDKAANDTKRTVKIVTIRNSTPTAVQEALYGLMGVNTNTRSRGYDSGRSSGFPQGGAFMGGGFPGGFPGGGAPFMFGRGSDGRGDFDRGDREGRGFDRGGGGGGGFPGFPFGGGGDRRP